MDLNGRQGQQISLKSGVEHLALGGYVSEDTVGAPCHSVGFPVLHLVSRRERLGAGEPPGRDYQATEGPCNMMTATTMTSAGLLCPIHLFGLHSVKAEPAPARQRGRRCLGIPIVTAGPGGGVHSVFQNEFWKKQSWTKITGLSTVHGRHWDGR